MELKIEYADINSIKPYKNNAKQHPQEQIEQIKNSIVKFGMDDPIGVWKDEIVEGHGRLIACKELGFEKVPIIRLDHLTDTQRKAYTLAHNKLTMNSDFDLDILESELEDLSKELDMSDFGFENIDIEEETEIVEDEVPEVPEEPKAKLGDIYQLGNHRLMCGDSTSVTDIDKLLNGNKIDMIYTDPPYGMDLDTDYSKMTYNKEWSKDRKCKSGKNYEQGIVDEFNPEMINTIMSLNVKETFLWGADYFAELLPNKNDGAWIVWDKRDENIGSFDKMFGSMFELCWSKNKHKREIARIRWCGCFGTEKEFDKKRYHPTQKPTELSRWFIDRYSKENNTILDLFGGSGSTLIACEQLNRKCYMMELDPKYIDVIIQRWENFTGRKAIKIND